MEKTKTDPKKNINSYKYKIENVESQTQIEFCSV